MARLSPSLLCLLLACASPPPPAPPSPPAVEVAPEALTCPAPDAASWPVHLRDEPAEPITQIAHTLDRTRVAGLYRDKMIQVRDAQDGRLIAEVEAPGTETWANPLIRLDRVSPDQLRVQLSDPDVRGLMLAWLLTEAAAGKSGPAEVTPLRYTLTGRGAPVREATASLTGALGAPTGHDRMLAQWPLALGVATAGADQISTFDPLTLASRATFRGGINSTILLSPDEKTLLLQHDAQVTLLDTATGKIVVESGPHQWSEYYPLNKRRFATDRSASRAIFSPLAVWGGYELMVVDLAARKVLLRKPVRDANAQEPARISADGKRVCVVTKSDACLVLDAETGKEQARVSLGAFDPPSFAAEKPEIFEISSGCLVARDPATLKTRWLSPSQGAQVGVRRVFADEEGQRAALLGSGQQKRFFLLRPGEATMSASLYGLSSQTTLLGTDGQPLISALDSVVIGSRGALVSFSPSQPRFSRWETSALHSTEIKETTRAPRAARFSHDEKWLAFTDADGNVSLWNLDSSEVFSLPDASASEVIFTADDRFLVGVGLDGTLTAWPTLSRTSLASWSLGLGARASAFQGQFIAAHSPASSQIVLLDVASRSVIRLPDCLPDQHALALAFSSRSVLLASGSTPGALCDLRSGALLARLAPGEAPPTTRVALDRRSDRLATVASADDSDKSSLVRVRDASTGRLLLSLPFPGVSPASIEAAFIGGSLLVRHGAEATLFSLEGCESLDLRLVERGERLGWLASDREGHWEGDQVGRASAWVRGPDGRDLPRAEGAKWQQKGLLARFLGRPGP